MKNRAGSAGWIAAGSDKVFPLFPPVKGGNIAIRNFLDRFAFYTYRGVMLRNTPRGRKMREIKTILAALASLKGKKSASPRAALQLRVARAFLRRQANGAYDLLARLLLLEGAAGVPHGTFTGGKGGLHRGLRKAKAFFADYADTMDPLWFSEKDTGAWLALSNRIDGTLSRFGIHDPDKKLEISHNLMMGLGAKGGERSRPLYKIGEKGVVSIQEGREGPLSLLRGVAGAYFTRQVMNELKREKRRRDLVEQNKDMIYDPRSHDVLVRTDPFKMLTDLLTDPTNPLGKRMRGVFRYSYKSLAPQDKNGKKVGEIMFESFFKDGNFPPFKEGAAKVGISVAGFGQIFSQRVLPRVILLWSRAVRLHRDLESYLLQHGGGELEAVNAKEIVNNIIRGQLGSGIRNVNPSVFT